MRALLLTTSHSYRNEAFQRAATRLGIDLIYGNLSRRAQNWTIASRMSSLECCIVTSIMAPLRRDYSAA